MTAAARTFEARTSRLRTGLLMLLALGMTALSVAVFFIDSLLAKIIAPIGAIFFLGATFAIARILFDGAVQVRIDSRGVYWRRWAEKPIAFSAIREARETDMMGQRFLSLWLWRPEEHPPTSLMGRLANANKTLGFGDVNLSMQGLDRSHADLVAAYFDWRGTKVRGGGPARPPVTQG